MRCCAAVFLLSVLLPLTTEVSAVTTHQWSKSFGGPFLDQGEDVAIDGAGDVILVAGASDSLDFGGGPLGAGRGIIAKYSSTGLHVWSKSVTASPVKVATDNAGNIVITGFTYTADPIDFGGGPLSGFGTNDMFVAKYDAAGNHVWSRRCGASGWYTQGEGIAMDGSGNTIVCGRFGGTVSFGGAPVAQLGNLDIFLVKYAPDGTHQWTNRLGSSNSEYAYLAVDGAENIVLAGYFDHSVSFGGSVMTSYGSGDVFIAKFSASGLHQWSHGFGNTSPGNTSNDYAEAVAIDGSGRILVTGKSSTSVNFGGGAVGKSFLVSFGSDGAHQWSKGFNGHAFAVAADASGNIAITGNLSVTDQDDFGGGPLALRGPFAAQFDALGTHLFSQRFSDFTNSFGKGVATDEFGGFALAGRYVGNVDFGGGVLTSNGAHDIFLARFGQQPLPVLFARFDAVPRGAAVDIEWDIWSDESLSSFTLLRRENGTPRMNAVTSGDPLVSQSYRDASIEPGKTYDYQLVIRNTDGDAFSSPIATVTVPPIRTSVGPSYPNPFNPRTTIAYSVGERMPVTIEIVDVSGVIVTRLQQGVREAGSYRAEWDGRDAAGRPVSSGVYFYRLANVKGGAVGKMTLLK